MMGIGQPQQVEVLARQLKENGIACSYDEAFEKAEIMIKVTENKPSQPDEQVQIVEQRYKFLLNSQKNKFTEEIDSLKNCMGSITTEIIDIKRQLKEQKQLMQKPKVVVQQKLNPAESKQEIKPEAKQEQPEDKPQLNPDDFAVEKIFYCGQK